MAKHKKSKSTSGKPSEDEKRRLAFGALVKEWRKAKGLSQRGVGNRIGIHQNHIGRYEKGAVWPSVSVLITLAETLGTSLDRLVLGEKAEAKEAATAAAASGVAPKESTSDRTRLAALAEQAEALSASDQSVVIALIEAFLLKVKVVEMTRG